MAVRVLLATLIALGPFGFLSLDAVEHITLRRDGDVIEVSGRLVADALDGGVMIQARDNVLWTAQPEELVRRRADETPFRFLSRAALTKKLRDEMPSGFLAHHTAHYVICYNTSKAYARWCGALFERLYRGFHTFWTRRGMEFKEPDTPLVALVFRSKTAFARYAQPELGDATDSIVGYYSLRTNRITMYDLTGVEALFPVRQRIATASRVNQVLSQPNAQPTVATIVHEATHQLAFNCGLHTRYADIPLWVSEGIAMFFETPDLTSSQGWGGIGVNRGRLFRLRQYQPRRPPDSLATLLQEDTRFRDPKQATDAYAEAWGLCHFLLNRYPEQFTVYLRQLAEKEPLLYDQPEERLQLFESSFGQGLKDLDRELQRYFERLR